MDSYVAELEKQNEELKQLLSQCQNKVDSISTKVWKWYDVKVVNHGATTQFFTDTSLEEVVFKLLYPMMEMPDIEEMGKFISIKCYSGALLIWTYDLIRRRATDSFGRETKDWYGEFDNGMYPGYSNKSFKTYAEYKEDLERYAARLKERRERLHRRA